MQIVKQNNSGNFNNLFKDSKAYNQGENESNDSEEQNNDDPNQRKASRESSGPPSDDDADREEDQDQVDSDLEDMFLDALGEIQEASARLNRSMRA